MEARRKARYDTALFSSVEDYQQYKQKFDQRKVVPRRSINFSQLKHFGFGDSSVGWDGCQSWRFSSRFSRLWCRHFIHWWPMGLEDRSCSWLEELRSNWAWRVSAAFSTFLQLSSRCMRSRRGPLCQDSSLERLFRGCADLQMPRGWANHRHTTWPCLVESFIIWSAPSYCHEVDIETKSPILRHSLWTWLLLKKCYFIACN